MPGAQLRRLLTEGTTVDDILLGIVALVFGAAFCFRGYLAMRVVIPLWGALIGFWLGAGLAATITGETFLATALTWVAGFIVALVFGFLAYLYYEISVILSMAGIGYALGATLAATLGITWSWAILLSGIAAGAVLAILALAIDLPMTLLTILTAFAGASVVVGGLMLVLGTVNVADADADRVAVTLTSSPWWFAVYVALAITGMVIQFRDTDRRRSGLRSAWAADGGRSTRPA